MESDRILLDGEARIGRDVDQIASAIRSGMPQWKIGQPRIERLREVDGIRFDLEMLREDEGIASTGGGQR